VDAVSASPGTALRKAAFNFTRLIQRKSVSYNYTTSGMNLTDREGISVFYKDENGNIFHTYSTYARGIDAVNPTYQFLDLVPLGRNETPKNPQDWVRHHDRY